jgi:hypothetical protein
MKRKQTPDFYLGLLVGEIIFLRYLPTLEVDSLKSLHVVSVGEHEKLEADRLHQILNDTYNDGTNPETKWGVKKSTEIAHKNWMGYINGLAENYLPEKLHCRFTKIQVNDINEFKSGITEYLWNTDLSWYETEDDFWTPTPEHSWFSEVILTRKID